MRSKFYYYSFLLCLHMLFACREPEKEAIPVNRTSYTIEDEPEADRTVIFLESTPTGTIQHTLTAELIYSRKYISYYYDTNYGKEFYLDSKDDQLNYTLDVHTYKYALSPNNYSTVDLQSKVSLGEVFVALVVFDKNGRLLKKFGSAQNLPSFKFKYEHLNSQYDLLTFDFNVNKSMGGQAGSLQGRLKIKK